MKETAKLVVEESEIKNALGINSKKINFIQYKMRQNENGYIDVDWL